MDSQVHKKYMGAGNETILSNLEKLSAAGARIYIRIPTIKEVNGTDKDMKAIIRYLQRRISGWPILIFCPIITPAQESMKEDRKDIQKEQIFMHRKKKKWNIL